MRFVNRGESTQIRTNGIEGYEWIILKTGEEIDISEQQGINYGLKTIESTESDEKPLKVTEGKIGSIKVETKQKISFKEELDSIPGIGQKTIKDILEVFKNREELIDAIKQNKSIPIRDDIEKKLREKYE